MSETGTGRVDAGQVSHQLQDFNVAWGGLLDSCYAQPTVHVRDGCSERERGLQGKTEGLPFAPARPLLP